MVHNNNKKIEATKVVIVMKYRSEPIFSMSPRIDLVIDLKLFIMKEISEFTPVNI